MPPDDAASTPAGHPERKEPTVQLVLRTPADPDCLDSVHDLLDELWYRAPEVSDLDRMTFETAVAEVAANIVQHAGDRRGVDLALTLSACADCVEAQFRDTGQPVGVDLDALPAPSVSAESGRGIAIARATVDEVSYHREGEENYWRLLRHRTG